MAGGLLHCIYINFGDILQSLIHMVTFSHMSLQFIEDLSSTFTVFKFLGSEPVLVVHYVMWVLLILVLLLKSQAV